MSFNNNVQLIGFLGQDPKSITTEDSAFTSFSLATTDSYQVSDGEKIVWKNKETVWHDVVVFSPTASKHVAELKKGNRVKVSGEISYRTFKDEKGKNRKQAAIIANYVEQFDQQKQESLTAKVVDDLVEKLTA